MHSTPEFDRFISATFCDGYKSGFELVIPVPMVGPAPPSGGLYRPRWVDVSFPFGNYVVNDTGWLDREWPFPVLWLNAEGTGEPEVGPQGLGIVIPNQQGSAVAESSLYKWWCDNDTTGLVFSANTRTGVSLASDVLGTDYFEDALHALAALRDIAHPTPAETLLPYFDPKKFGARPLRMFQGRVDSASTGGTSLPVPPATRLAPKLVTLGNRLIQPHNGANLTLIADDHALSVCWSGTNWEIRQTLNLATKALPGALWVHSTFNTHWDRPDKNGFGIIVGKPEMATLTALMQLNATSASHVVTDPATDPLQPVWSLCNTIVGAKGRRATGYIPKASSRVLWNLCRALTTKNSEVTLWWLP